MKNTGSDGGETSGGYLLLHKSPGRTSFESLGFLKKALKTGKIGHTGTLDKFAQGLMVVLAGRATKLMPWFVSSEKCYRGTIRFGQETDTLDPEGTVVAEGPVPDYARLESVLPEFTGEIMQAPPLYSAVHINGERAHSLARSGRDHTMEKRPVSVYSLDLVSYDPPFAEITVRCSKGTYIRSLARDIALAAGSRGHLVSLTRTSIGGFSLEDAFAPDDGLSADPWNAVKPIDETALNALGLPWYRVDEKTALSMVHGKPIQQDSLGTPLGNSEPGGQCAAGVFSDDGEFIAIIEKKEATWCYGYVYARK
ncbi:tRNA pseudouridine(55) synthase TruB [Breznakiella homolactica]|uniref:tRNA pseudouridine synthase B n=1 Tax=Breznakiella homolactica TaxID=2798577 RepID=A0A7T7XL35_9SPIR|nr:tRNA pseudouridine(55) synthase TruB [Breznakiella homolactica]QQO08188.1 tRNA pseudouridine(55) synthase TruB [Breznakiella homolactica]